MSYLTNNPQTFKGDIVVPNVCNMGESRVVNFATNEQFKFYYTPTTIQNDYWSPSTGGQNISSYNKSTGVLTVNKLVATDPSGNAYSPNVIKRIPLTNNTLPLSPAQSASITNGFSLTAGHYYRLTFPVMSAGVGSGSPTLTDNVQILFDGDYTPTTAPVSNIQISTNADLITTTASFCFRAGTSSTNTFLKILNKSSSLTPTFAYVGALIFEDMGVVPSV